MLFSVHLLASCARWRGGPRAVWIVALCFIAGSYSYHLHVIRGQKYVLYLFLLSAAYYCFDKKKLEFVSGFVLGFLATFRLNAVFILVPFLFLRKWKFLAGTLGGLALGIALPVVFAGPAVWSGYFTQGKVLNGASLSSVYAGAPVYHYGNSFFDGAAPDVQRSFLEWDPAPDNINASFLGSRSVFPGLFERFQFFSKKIGILLFLLFLRGECCGSGGSGSGSVFGFRVVARGSRMPSRG